MKPARTSAALALLLGLGADLAAHAAPPTSKPVPAAPSAARPVAALPSPKPGAPAKAPAPPPKPATTKPTAPQKHASRSQGGAPIAYKAAIKGWHTPTTGKVAPEDAQGRPMLALFVLNTQESLAVPVLSDDGAIRAEDLDRVTRVLREPGSGHEHTFDPRLVALAYRVQRHFHAAELRVISGYRTPKKTSHSNHGRGRALDFIVPGATDEEVAKYCRELGFVGVGIYPTSGFVHLDVRDRSYFWIDASAPGRRNRERGILGDLAQKSDLLARDRGDKAAPSYGPAIGLDGWIRSHGAAGSAEPPVEEDDTEAEGESP